MNAMVSCLDVGHHGVGHPVIGAEAAASPKRRFCDAGQDLWPHHHGFDGSCANGAGIVPLMEPHSSPPVASLFSGLFVAFFLASCASSTPSSDLAIEATAPSPSPAAAPVEVVQSAEEWAQEVTRSCGFAIPSACDGDVCVALGTFPQNDANGMQFAAALAYRSPVLFAGLAVTRGMGFSDTPCKRTLGKAAQGDNFLWGHPWTSHSGWIHMCFATHASGVHADIPHIGRAAGLCDNLLVQHGEGSHPFTALLQAAVAPGGNDTPVPLSTTE